MAATSSSVHSRASTTRLAPWAFKKRAAAAFEQDICVEIWKETPSRLQASTAAQSATIAASIWGCAQRRVSSNAASSLSKRMLFSVR